MSHGINPNYQPDNGYSVTLSRAPGRGERYRVRCFWLDPHNFNSIGQTASESYYSSYDSADRAAKQLAKQYNVAQIFYNC